MATKQVTDTVTRDVRICDRCGGTERFLYGAGGVCQACGRDVCGGCSVSDPDEPGDYPDHWCKECWELGERYRQKIENLRHQCSEDCRSHRRKWYGKCKDARDTDGQVTDGSVPS